MPGKETSILQKPLVNCKTIERQQEAAFGVLSLTVAGLTGTILLSRDTMTNLYRGVVPGNLADVFRPFMGSIHPLLTRGLVAVVGGASLSWLGSRGWFRTYSSRSMPGISGATIMATLFGLGIFFAEIIGIIRLPSDLDVPPP